ncbi:MAG TPA: CCA tRNA nucleotidyltransferase [Alphaproteobacteria bacterium]|nr:CCA tRNA nucleotidyltransferase [Alphaproteobacteria bacterium]
MIAALDAAAGQPRFVGGCVRDALLDRPVRDIDIATPLRPDEVMAALRRAGLKSVPTGIAHGTVTAVAHGRPFEVTTLRVDVETDGRHALVSFTDDWQADAARRDFTMNALSADPDGTVHDYFGGVADAWEGRVRFVGDPVQRIEEDVLRLLRLFRFHAHYGSAPLDPEALAAVQAYAPRLAGLSGERIRAELLKLLAAADPVPTWRLMIAHGVAVEVLGEPGDVDRLAALVPLEPAPDPVRRLAALVRHCNPDALADRLRLSNADRNRLAFLARPPAIAPDLNPADLRRAIYRYGGGGVTDALLLAAAGDPSEGRYRPLIEAARTTVLPAFPVRGRDLLDLGLSPGQHVGRILKELERWWIESDFAADRAACLDEARKRVARR